jgi:hypothetical protein
MQNLMQSDARPTRPKGNPAWGNRASGTATASGNPDGKASVSRRRAALLHVLIGDLGGEGCLTATDRVLVAKAAELLARRPQGPQADLHRVRTVNAADRLLRLVRKRLGLDRKRGRAPSAVAPSLDDLLARRTP